MGNKYILVGIIGLFILLVGGFFLPPYGEERMQSIYETEWSQAEDYGFNSANTVATNTKAGFSFKVPEHWEIGEESFGSEYSVLLFSPDIRFDNDNFLQEGCFISINTVIQESEVVYLEEVIKNLRDDPSLHTDKKVVEVSGYSGIETLVLVSELIGDTVEIKLPIDEETVASFVLTTRKDVKEACSEVFNNFISNISFFDRG